MTPHTEGPEEAARQASVGDAFRRLYTDARGYAAAEAEKQKLRLSLIMAGVRNAAIFAVTAFLILFASLVALLVGLIHVLEPMIGPLGATLVIFAAGIVIAILLLLLAKGCITRMKKAIAP
ncbi:hypothetical protein RLDS_24145 [Sphingobium lactosutens DS20]|uniref:Phage holin family protein n=1 Tax=Sphingobium lactosutens DS20 TaxID=1331060 RepID=T0IPB4_9SPHN|nr:hypothetical protein RLDS_24145 [Sphingobium lactosutens DS20]